MTINSIKKSFFYLVGAKFTGLMGAETLKFPLLLIILTLFSFYSCSEHLYSDEVKKGQFCQYFTIETGTYFDKGVAYKTASPRIVYLTGDKVSHFIKNHSYRFEYLLYKIFSTLDFNKFNKDSLKLKKEYCNDLMSDNFYNHFSLLISGKKGYSKLKINFSEKELMLVASRFFMCDTIREKDTTIGYHICVVLNDQFELKDERDLTALEAFCYESIFYYLLKNRNISFVRNFSGYVYQASREEKNHFVNFHTYLQTVKNKCYRYMEKDKDLLKALMDYYQKNKSNINFTID